MSFIILCKTGTNVYIASSIKREVLNVANFIVVNIHVEVLYYKIIARVSKARSNANQMYYCA